MGAIDARGWMLGGRSGEEWGKKILRPRERASELALCACVLVGVAYALGRTRLAPRPEQKKLIK